MFLSKRNKHLKNRKRSKKKLNRIGGGQDKFDEIIDEECPYILEKNWTNNWTMQPRDEIRRILNEKSYVKCDLNLLKKKYSCDKLYNFGFSIRELLDNGFTLAEMFPVLQNEIFNVSEFKLLTESEKSQLLELDNAQVERQREIENFCDSLKNIYEFKYLLKKMRSYARRESHPKGYYVSYELI
jgi:hypothetical protein